MKSALAKARSRRSSSVSKRASWRNSWGGSSSKKYAAVAAPRLSLRESLRSWEASKDDATRRVQRTTHAGAGGAVGATVAQLVVETQHGDPRYLEVARKVLADQRRVWGLDAPQKLDVRATRGPFEAMTDAALAAELARQRQLLTAIEPAAPIEGPGEGTDAE